MWCYIVIDATLCVSFSLKWKATNVFLKHILKLKAYDQTIQARKKLFCCMIVKNYSCNVLCKFLIKMKPRGEAKSNNRHPSWLYCAVVGLLEAVNEESCSYKFHNIQRKKPVLRSLFNKVEGFQAFSVDIMKFLRLPTLKNICQWLLLGCSNDSLLHRSKGSRSILYNSVKLQGLSHRFSILFFKSVSLVLNRVAICVWKP